LETVLSSSANIPKLYGDIFFIINFCMDLIVIAAVSLVMKCEKRPIAFALVACFTSAFQISRLYLPGSDAVGFILWLVTAMLACVCAFPRLRGIKLFVAFSLFLLISGGLSLLLTILFKAIGRPTLPEEMTKGSGGVIPLCVCLFSGFVARLLKRVFSALGKRLKGRSGSRVATLGVTSGEKTVEFSAYRDSGNLLREPISGLPVIILGSKNMEKILPEGLRSVFFSEKDSDRISLSDASRVRIIPIMPVGTGGARILFGYVPDRITLDGKEVRACIALDKGNASFGGCEALLPSVLA
jgi:sigma-E processing peptidase SpoIIGA